MNIVPKRIMEISREMNRQNNRMTKNPLFMVYREFEEVRPDGIGESARKSMEDIGEEMLCKECLEKYNNDEDLPDFCWDCDSECFYSVETIERTDDRPGVFLTAKECDEHIKLKRHDYYGTNPRSYAIGSTYSDDMTAVMEFIRGLTIEEFGGLRQGDWVVVENAYQDEDAREFSLEAKIRHIGDDKKVDLYFDLRHLEEKLAEQIQVELDLREWNLSDLTKKQS